MSLSPELANRSENKCELCGASEGLTAYTVPPKSGDDLAHQVATCTTCHDQLMNPDQLDVNHWRCLNESMWSQEPAVQVVAYRMLRMLSSEDWAQDALSMIYLNEETMEWAQDTSGDADEPIVHKDSNGHVLTAGDTVVLIKDLNVKGANFTAKRGTAVRRIRLDPDNANHIEGKVDGQTIVILTQYVKKS